MLIYLITNNLNNKKYVGQTSNSLDLRWRQHTSKHQGYCRVLHNAIMKYGKENFSIIEIAKASSIEELNQMEEAFIKEFNTIVPNGYNLLPGGNNKKHHDDSKRKMSITRTGKKVPALSKPRGPRPPEVGKKISSVKKGKSNGLLGKKRPGMIRLSTRKKVQATNKITKEELTFNSIKEAAAYFKCTHANIVACLKGRRPLAQNHSWKYL